MTKVLAVQTQDLSVDTGTHVNAGDGSLHL